MSCGNEATSCGDDGESATATNAGCGASTTGDAGAGSGLATSVGELDCTGRMRVLAVPLVLGEASRSHESRSSNDGDGCAAELLVVELLADPTSSESSDSTVALATAESGFVLDAGCGVSSGVGVVLVLVLVLQLALAPERDSSSCRCSAAALTSPMWSYVVRQPTHALSGSAAAAPGGRGGPGTSVSRRRSRAAWRTPTGAPRAGGRRAGARSDWRSQAR